MTMRDPTNIRDNAALDQAEAARQAAEARAEIEDLKWLLTHRPGRRFAWRLMGEAGVFRSTFHTSGSVMTFNEGKRAAGLQLLTQIMEHAPDAFLQMQNEAKSR